jgi:hypothetical protein
MASILEAYLPALSLSSETVDSPSSSYLSAHSLTPDLGLQSLTDNYTVEHYDGYIRIAA